MTEIVDIVDQILEVRAGFRVQAAVRRRTTWLSAFSFCGLMDDCCVDNDRERRDESEDLLDQFVSAETANETLRAWGVGCRRRRGHAFLAPQLRKPALSRVARGKTNPRGLHDWAQVYTLLRELAYACASRTRWLCNA